MTRHRTIPTVNDRAAAAPQHVRILASAGSGKTWQLSNRYLRLIWMGAQPHSILASTFTRLAAGEIRDRILARLVDAADDPQARMELAMQIHDGGEITRAATAAQLRILARNIHRMNIRTLDSFFASIVSAFPYELGLSPDCRMLDEDEEVMLRQQAIARVINERDPQQLIESLRLLTRGDAVSSIGRTLDREISVLHEISHEAHRSAWDCLPRAAILEHDELAAAIERFCAHRVPYTDKRWINAHRVSCEQVREHRWSDFLGKGLASKISTGEAEYCRKPFDNATREVYEPIIMHAQGFIVNRSRDMNLAAADLLERFGIAYAALKRERRAMTFSDLTRALDPSGVLWTSEELAFRLDQRLEHVLLDEFQDTSIAQWRALYPLLHELVSDETTGRSFFCVGDLKQSIYEWRSASPEILENLPELLFGPGAGEEHLASRPLDVSFRSARPIMECVNAVFTTLPTNAALDNDDDADTEQVAAARAAAAWHETFHEHDIAPRNEHRAGCAEVHVVALRQDGRQDDERLSRTMHLVRSLHLRRPDLSIGILTRTNKVARRLLFLLQREQLPATGPGGGALTDVPAVGALLDLLQLAHAPEDTASAFHVASSPLGEVLGFAEWNDDSARRAFARSVRASLYEHGFGPYLANLVPRLLPHCGPRESERVLRLIDMAESVDAGESRDCAAFIAAVEQRTVADQRPAPIQVLTIHKAKGLEYDAVILPELQWSLAGVSTPKYVLERDGIIGPITRITRYISKDSNVREMLRERGCDLEPLFAREHFRRVRESLSMLYVALTRARSSLTAFIDPAVLTKKGEVDKRSLRTAAGLIWNALLVPGELPQPGAVLAQFGDPDWIDRDRQAVDEIEEPEPIAAPARREGAPSEPSTAITRRVRILTSDAASSRAQGIRLADRLNTAAEATDRGTAIHELFAQVEWLDEFVLDENTARRIVRAVMPRRDDSWIEQRIAEFRAAIARDGLRDALSLDRAIARAGAPAQSCRVWRERPFARLRETGRLERGTIDRLVLAYDDSGRVVAGEVVDYKTDRIAGPGLAQDAAARYRPQLETYRTAVADMYRVDPHAIGMMLIFINDGVVYEFE